MHPLAETLLDEPVIAAVKTDESLTAALASPCSAVFLLASTLLTVDGLVHRIHDAGKLAVVHIDLVDGLSSREIAVDSLNALCHPDGIISTRPTLIRRARHRGLLTVQRAYISSFHVYVSAVRYAAIVVNAAVLAVSVVSLQLQTSDATVAAHYCCSVSQP